MRSHLYKTLLVVYNTFLGLSLKMALKKEPKYVAIENDLIIV